VHSQQLEDFHGKRVHVTGCAIKRPLAVAWNHRNNVYW